MLRNEAKIKVITGQTENLQFKVNKKRAKQQPEVKTTGEDGVKSWLSKTEVDIIFIFSHLFFLFVCLCVFF